MFTTPLQRNAASARNLNDAELVQGSLDGNNLARVTASSTDARLEDRHCNSSARARALSRDKRRLPCKL
eukprot:scaffold7891_cov390-Prasinococcus_capsulatus_cf.AAC.3